jgi:hypothetical protein
MRDDELVPFETTEHAVQVQGVLDIVGSQASAQDAHARRVVLRTRAEAEKTTTRFTRFVDDIALSGDNPSAHIGNVARHLSSCGLSIHRGEKLKIRPRSMPQKITGLNINSGRPTVPRQYRDMVRSSIHGLAAISDSVKRAEAVRKISGRIAYVRQFHPTAAQRLSDQLACATATSPKG